MREHLETEDARLLIAPATSAGSITAERRAHDGWHAGLVDLSIETGELVVGADGDGVITLEKLGVWLGPIEIPPSVFGNEAQLTRVRLELPRPQRLVVTWTGDDEARIATELELELSWALTVDGSTTSLGAPDLPPLPLDLVLTGNGARVHAEVRAQSPGELWSWADLVRLEDLSLILDAATPAR